MKTKILSALAFLSKHLCGVGVVACLGTYGLICLQWWLAALAVLAGSGGIDIILLCRDEDTVSEKIQDFCGLVWDRIITVAVIIATVGCLGNVSLAWWQLAILITQFTLHGHWFANH